ncbi:MAG TPA: hypothetical protein VKA46_23550 [Gemmataceae bacterium]|nr:hypothetical protein [Gemmataceae bacterium]
MTASIDPVVRLMAVCERAVPDPENPHKVDLRGLLSTVLVDAAAVFPVRVPQLSVYVMMTGGRGVGRAQIVVVDADTETDQFGSARHEIRFGSDPLAVVARSFRLLNCPFPSAGLYLVEFRYNEHVLASQPLIVKRR